LERLSLAAIARITGVSEQWLQNKVNKKYEEVRREVAVSKKSKGRLTIECDELWSYVGKKDNKQWIWLAIGRDNGSSHRRPLNNYGIHRQCAVSYTDFWEAYSIIFPRHRHRAGERGRRITSNALIVR